MASIYTEVCLVFHLCITDALKARTRIVHQGKKSATKFQITIKFNQFH